MKLRNRTPSKRASKPLSSSDSDDLALSDNSIKPSPKRRKQNVRVVDSSSGDEFEMPVVPVQQGRTPQKAPRKQRAPRKTLADPVPAPSSLPDDEESDEEFEEMDLDGPSNAIPMSNEYLHVDLSTDNKPAKKKRVQKPPPVRLPGVTKHDRQVQMDLHQVHLLCLLAYSLRVNRIANNELLQSMILSTMPRNIVLEPLETKEHLKWVVNWFRQRYTLAFQGGPQAENETKERKKSITAATLWKCWQHPNAPMPESEFVLLFLILCRALGYNASFIHALQPLQFKVPVLVRIARALAMAVEDQESVDRLKSLVDYYNERTKNDTIYAPCQWIEIEENSVKIPVHVVHGYVDEEQNIPNDRLSYVLSLNCKNSVVDVTEHYAADIFISNVMRKRPCHAWWMKILEKYAPFSAKSNEKAQSNAPLTLPKSISGFKDHPMFILERHLKKYEILVSNDPSDIAGEFKGEKVYYRRCVHALHTKEVWLKEGRVTRPDEKPIKFVKSLSALRKQAVNTYRAKQGMAPRYLLEEEDLSVGLYSYAQTMDYIPPPVINGQIPRNSYGNLDLFKPNMLPKGCRHVQHPFAMRAAKEFGFDAVEAITGFDFVRGHSVPHVEGVVVLLEHGEKVLQRAEEMEREKREQERKQHEDLIYQRWKRLIKGVLVRAHVSQRYGEE